MKELKVGDVVEVKFKGVISDIDKEDSFKYWVDNIDCSTQACWAKQKDITLISRPHTITIDGKDIKLSEESYQELKKSLT